MRSSSESDVSQKGSAAKGAWHARVSYVTVLAGTVRAEASASEASEAMSDRAARGAAALSDRAARGAAA